MPRWITATLPARLAGKSASSQPALEALAVVVGGVKSITAIGVPAGTAPEPEASIVAKSVFATHAGEAAGTDVSVGGASSVNTDAENGCSVDLPVAAVVA